MKVTHMILNRRITWPVNTQQPRSKQKSSTWFNFYVEEAEAVCKQLDKIFKTNPSSNKASHYVYLDVYYEGKSQSATKRRLLERWTFSYGEEYDSSSDGYLSPRKRRNSTDISKSDGELSVAYKKAMALMRSIFTYLVLLPAYDIFLRNQKNRRLPNKLCYCITSSVHGSKTTGFEEGSTNKFIFSPFEVPSLNSSIKLSVVYRKKDLELDDIFSEQESQKGILTESQFIPNFFANETSKPPVQVKKANSQPALDDDLRRMRDRANSMPVKRGFLHEAIKKEEEKRLNEQHNLQRPPVYKPPAEAEETTQQQHVKFEPQQQLLPQQPVRSETTTYGQSLPTNISISKQHSIPIKNKRQTQPAIFNDETPPFSRQLSFEGRNRTNSTGSNAAYSSSASPPFGNNLLSSSWKKKHFQLSFSPLNESPMNSYNPPSSSLLSSSLKQMQNNCGPAVSNIISNRLNSLEDNRVPSVLTVRYRLSMDLSSEDKVNGDETDLDDGLNPFADFAPSLLDNDSFDVHSYNYNQPSNYSSGNFGEDEDDAMFQPDQHAAADGPFGPMIFANYGTSDRESLNDNYFPDNEWTMDLDQHMDDQSLDKLIHDIEQAPKQLKSCSRSEVMKKPALNTSIAEVVDRISKLKQVRFATLQQQ